MKTETRKHAHLSSSHLGQPLRYPRAGSLNKNLTAAILKEYARFANDPALSGAGWQPNGANQRFFEWQTAGGWNATLGVMPEAKVLTDFMQLSTDNFLLNFGLSVDTVKARDRRPHQWATVHRAGMHHMRHSHPDNLVSGVYYVSVPSDAGPIVLHDPRAGGHPPFDDKVCFFFSFLNLFSFQLLAFVFDSCKIGAVWASPH
jgi:hypothetical protein